MGLRKITIIVEVAGNRPVEVPEGINRHVFRTKQPHIENVSVRVIWRFPLKRFMVSKVCFNEVLLLDRSARWKLQKSTNLLCDGSC